MGEYDQSTLYTCMKISPCIIYIDVIYINWFILKSITHHDEVKFFLGNNFGSIYINQ
jgi:hypothetical protein